MKRRNPRIGFEYEGHRWSMVIDRETGVATLRQHSKHAKYIVHPGRIVELAVGQRTMPFADANMPKPKHVPTDWEKISMAKHPVGAALLQATGHLPVQTTFA